MRFFFSILLISIIACNHLDTDNLSLWEKQKKSFKYRKKTEFVVDDILMADLTNLKKSSLHIHGEHDTVYLYSWQGSDKFKNEFTVIGYEDKYRPTIFYIITNKKDSVISSIKIAGFNDSGYGSMFKTVFVTKDTFFVAGVRHAIEPNGEISVILKEYSNSANIDK